MTASYIDCYYARTALERAPRAPLEGSLQAEVCVIGGGLAGLSTALELAERGVAVVLLEARRVGWGASGRNGGFVSPGFARAPRGLVKRRGRDHARALYALSREGAETVRRRIADYAIECGPLVDGILAASWFDDGDGLKRYRDFMAETFAEEKVFWPRERVREALLSERYHDGLLTPRGFQFHPLNYSLGMAAAAERRGATILEASPVTGLELEGEEKVLRTASGGVRARHAVFACGGYLERLHPALARAMLPIATYVMATEPLGDRLASAIRVPYAVHDTRFALDYYRALHDTRLLWGGRITARRGEPRDLARLMLGDVLRVYPQLAGVRAEAAWSGLMSYAVHKMPQIGRLAPGVWYAMGFGGHGMNTTAMAGTLVAAAIAEDDDRYRLFAPFGLTPAGGPLGAAAAQLTYWYHQAKDALRSRLG